MKDYKRLTEKSQYGKFDTNCPDYTYEEKKKHLAVVLCGFFSAPNQCEHHRKSQYNCQKFSFHFLSPLYQLGFSLFVHFGGYLSLSHFLMSFCLKRSKTFSLSVSLMQLGDVIEPSAYIIDGILYPLSGLVGSLQVTNPNQYSNKTS